MNEQFLSPKEALSNKEEPDILSEAAQDVGLKVNLPRRGTEAYSRLSAHCKAYSDAVHREVTRNLDNPIFNQRERREAHDKMCVMLFGTKYDETDASKVKAASNFAHAVVGREQYIR